MASICKEQSDIVISGLSGRFPESGNVEEFKKNLFDGVDLVTTDDRRWPAGTFGLPAHSGKLKDLHNFDSQFFGIHAKQAEKIDPHLRLLLEVTYEAIIDAGVNPTELRGTKTGVFIGVSSSASEAEEFWSKDPAEINGYEIMGCARSMYANRISYSFDFRGPSFAVDGACSSSLLALNQAMSAIKSGQCTSAIVGGVNLMLKPQSSLELYRLHVLDIDGKSKSFDENAFGYIRSEAAVAIFLQKSSVARRVYATVVGTKASSDGHKIEGITFPSGSRQSELVSELLEEFGIAPEDIGYFEAHGTGTKVGDPEELNGLADVLCKNRKTPLLIGSVKSNMGHSEPASGLCAIAKVIIAMESGMIPQNLHFERPNPKIPALLDGRLKVVDKNHPWNGGYVGINSFGFGGANAHILLKSNPKLKRNNKNSTKIPRIFLVSGRTPEAVNYFLNQITKTPDDNELRALVNGVHEQNIAGHKYRGFTQIGDKVIREIGQVESQKRPVWLIYAGMGSQWSQMGRDMMKLDPFRKAIDRCTNVLKPYGINIGEILMKTDQNLEEDIIKSSVSITAVQVALTDTLKSLEIYPDGIIGHSLGESACGYSDGAFTVEQAILVSYFKAKTSLQYGSDGNMAAVGLSWEDCKKRCPPEVDLACHNSQNNVTVCGPPEIVQKFVQELRADKIFAKLIKSGNRAFHSQYISQASPKLKQLLQELIPDPKPRSSKWISSSIPKKEWNSPIGQLNSAEYHLNNFLKPVLFHDAVQCIPDHAIVVEVAPHGIMQSILKESLKTDCSYISLMQKGHEDNLRYFVYSLGRLYLAGAHPKVANLYEPISFPVGRGTPMLQSMIKWDHSIDWAVPKFPLNNSKSGEISVEFDLGKEEDQYLKGYTIDGRIHFPVLGYLVLVWKIFAKTLNEEYEKLPITFENIEIHRTTTILKDGPVKFSMNILRNSGNFELYEDDSIVSSGRVSIQENIENKKIDLSTPEFDQNPDELILNSSDIYKELRLRGYEYNGLHKGIIQADNRGNVGLLKWDQNWITFMDAMLQFSLLRRNERDLYLPSKIRKIDICPSGHLEFVANRGKDDETKRVPIHVYHDTNTIKSGGIEIQGIRGQLSIERQKTQNDPKLEKYVFIPFENNQPLCQNIPKSRYHSLTILLQTMYENCSLKPKIVEIAEKYGLDNLLATDIVQILEKESVIVGTEYIIVTNEDVGTYQEIFEKLGVQIRQDDIAKTLIDRNVNLIVVKDLLGLKKSYIIDSSLRMLEEGGFILTEEESEYIDESFLSKFGLELVSKQIFGFRRFLLLRQTINIDSNSIIIGITTKNFDWVEKITDALKKNESKGTKIYLVSQNDQFSGLMGLMTCIKNEPGNENVRSVLIQDKNVENFSIKSQFYLKQLKKDLKFNVLKNGIWGTFRHIWLDKTTEKGDAKVENGYLSNFNPNKTYVVIGGLGGIGLELTNWLVSKGATKIVLNSRNGIKNGYQSFCIRRWRAKNVTIVVNTTNVTNELGAKNFLKESNKIGPIGGIFNLAVVLRDALMENQTKDGFQTVCQSKSDVARNLDIASRNLCPDLDYFIMFSSMSCGRGCAGQANYGYANSIMERICESRQEDGLPGLTIQWGAIGDVGLILDSLKGGNDTLIEGTLPQKIGYVLDTLEFLIQLPYPVLSSVVLAEKNTNIPEPSSNLKSIIVGILGIKDVDTIQPNSSFSELGIDSNIIAEIKQVLKENCNLVLPTIEIGALTFGKLEELQKSETN